MTSESSSSALAWVRRAPPRSLDDAPEAVKRHLVGTQRGPRVLRGFGLFVAVLVGLAGPTLRDKAMHFAGATLFIGFGLLAVTRGVKSTTTTWLVQGRAEPWRVTAVETVAVRTAGGVNRIHEVTLMPGTGAPLFAYTKAIAPDVKAGLEVVVLVRGARALVFGPGNELLVALAVPMHRG